MSSSLSLSTPPASPLPPSRVDLVKHAMEASRKRLQTQTLSVWLLLVSVSLTAAENMADKSQLPSRDRSLKGRDEKMVVAGI